MEGTYTQRGHTHEGNIHTEATHPRKGLTNKGTYTWWGHTHQTKNIHSEVTIYISHREDIHTKGTYTRRRHIHGGDIYINVTTYTWKIHTQMHNTYTQRRYIHDEDIYAKVTYT